MEYRHSHKSGIAFFLLALLFTGFLFIGYNDHITRTTPNYLTLSDGWTITRTDGTTYTAPLTNSGLGMVNEGETVSISRTLEKFDFEHPCVSYFSIRAVVNIYLDQELIYSFGQDYYDTNTTVPKKINVAPLGDDYEGKTLKIQLTGTMKAAFSGLSPVSIGTRADLMTQRSLHIRVSFFTGIFLFTLGIIFIILSPYLFFYHNHDTRLLFSGLIALTLGLYILSFYLIIDGLVDNPLLNIICDYGSLYNIPTAFMGYLMSVHTGKAKKIFTGLFIFDVFLFLSSVVLHILHVRRFAAYTIILHVFTVAESILVVFLLIHFYLKSRHDSEQKNMSSDNIFLVGIVLFALLSLYDIINYNYLTYFSSKGEVYAELNGITIGSLILISCLLVSYLFFNIYSTNYDSLQSRISNLAYTDPLTGLANRARCEQMMKMLTEEKDAYTIISLDLNKLKQVNDTLGHHEGDRLLTGFATILSDCFWDANLIGRMGGDEFVVIMIEDRALNATKRIHELYSLINEWNHKEVNFSYSVSYGYAYSHEVPNGSAQEVYMLADNRMYEMKREHQGDREVTLHA
ncbi:GGDEF domain-containing protein [Butyrivibrio sp. MC2021]|uniref:GGDEF domain-containing protein n=1 Tax=Butyrivibrio sp. MC2021 TaxID=1408306 RepID=UPI00047AF567|nr:GGDEF domain-containing protein [Butyrivibrio sp. MC2021]